MVAVADERSTLRGTEAHGEGEVDALEELLHLLVESCSTDDNLVGLAAKGIVHLLANHLLHLLVHNRHHQQQAHVVVLNLREHTLADDLLNNHRHGNDQRGLYLGIGLSNERRAGQTCEVEDVNAVAEGEQELEGQSIHVGHGQDGNHVCARLHNGTQLGECEVEVSPQRTVRQHHTLRESRGAAGVVDERQFLGAVLVVVHVLLAEVFRILCTEELVQVLAGIGDLLLARYQQREVGQVHDGLQVGHLVGVDGLCHHIAHEEQFGTRVVHDVMHLLRHELV